VILSTLASGEASARTTLRHEWCDEFIHHGRLIPLPGKPSAFGRSWARASARRPLLERNLGFGFRPRRGMARRAGLPPRRCGAVFFRLSGQRLDGDGRSHFRRAFSTVATSFAASAALNFGLLHLDLEPLFSNLLHLHRLGDQLLLP